MSLKCSLTQQVAETMALMSKLDLRKKTEYDPQKCQDKDTLSQQNFVGFVSATSQQFTVNFSSVHKL